MINGWAGRMWIQVRQADLPQLGGDEMKQNSVLRRVAAAAAVVATVVGGCSSTSPGPAAVANAAADGAGDSPSADTNTTADAADSATDAYPADSGDTAAPPADALPSADAATADGAADALPCSPASCQSANPCVKATCMAGACQLLPAADGAGCDDGDPCTTADGCKAGSCVGGANQCTAMAAGIGNSPCKLEGELPKASAIELQPWFTKLPISQPIYLTPFADGTDRLVVLTRYGEIHLFDNQKDVGKTKLLLDLKSKVSTAGEGGLLSIAFHPQFGKNRKLYVNYTSVGKFSTVISEFTTLQDDAELINPASEKVLLTIVQPYSNHNGGQILFDQTGMLLIGMGDGGSANDPLGAGQDPKNLLGKVLRIDVDHQDPGKAYAVPKDNPFVASPGFAPEIWAMGMRNPWRMSMDRLTGQVWAADVGQNKWEEVDIIEKGKNYGWNTMEGKHCFNPAVNCNQTGLTLPVAEWPHGEANSITGGYVYRGSQNKGLFGSYVTADYATGKFWSVSPQGGEYQVKTLLDTSYAPVSFGEDRDGELYVVQLYPMAFWKVVELAVVPPAGAKLPQKLSETGCFELTPQLKAAPGVVPYDLNAPLWSDGAFKQRWLVLPAGATVTTSSAGPISVPTDPLQTWNFPKGTLLIKHFALGDAKKPVETRFLRREAVGWSAYTYRWNSAGTDAELLLGGGQFSYAITKGGKAETQVWGVPSMGQCFACHKGPTQQDQALGPQTAQLNRSSPALGGANQLELWAKMGMLSGAPAGKDTMALPDLALVDQGNGLQGDFEKPARAYLHANCSHCHRPGGGAPTSLDLRFDVALAKMNACGLPVQNGEVGVPGAQVIAPGAPDKSALMLRMAAGAGTAWLMPPVGVNLPHAAGYLLIKNWIAGLSACPK